MEFLARFLSALDQMPGLETFISCPMPTEHVISTKEYTLTARMFQNGCGWTSEEDAHHGFIKFLLPAMRRTNSTVKHLAVAEHDGGWFPSLLRPIDTLSFEKLTHIVLALGRGKASDLEDLGLCLRMATNLVELRLDMERGITSGHLVLDGLCGHDQARWWPQLRRLEFSEIQMSDASSNTSLVNLVSAHCATLRQLLFHRCQVSRYSLQAVAKIPGLQLSDVTITDGGTTGFNTVSESELLAYLNGQGSLPFNPEPDGSWNTTHTMFDPEATPTEALFEASREPGLYTDEDVRVILNNLHHTAPPLLRSEHSLYTREKRAKEMIRKGSSDPRGFISDTIPVSHWLFKHPDGSEAAGDEPLEFWSDWEDSFDDTSDDGNDHEESATDDGLVDAIDEDVVMLDGPAHSTARISGPGGNDGIDGDESASDEEDDSDESSMSDGEGSVFDGDDLIDTMEAPIPVMERRFQAIPLWNNLVDPRH
jgi:hypothetical protein